MAGAQAPAKDHGYNTGEEYQEVVGGPPTQSEAAPAGGRMATAVATGTGGSGFHGDPVSLPPDPPGRVSSYGAHAPPSVQQGELHGVGSHHS